MVLTIVGSGMLTIKKTVGYVTVTPMTECHTTKTVIVTVNDAAIKSVGYTPTTTTNVVLSIIAYTKACIRSGIVPTFIQGGSRSNVIPQFQILDGNPLVSWESPAEHSAGTYTAVVTEADVRAGLRLGILLVGDVWTAADDEHLLDERHLLPPGRECPHLCRPHVVRGFHQKRRIGR